MTLSVVDHGPGIAPERRADVFEPFQRLGDGTVGGTGRGLAVEGRQLHTNKAVYNNPKVIEAYLGKEE